MNRSAVEGFRLPLIAVLLSAALLSPPPQLLFAQAAPSREPSAQFTLNARTVIEDVVVTDKDGRAVPGLSQEDFRIFENGKPQSITFFEPNSAVVERVAQPSAPPPNTFTNSPLADSHNVTNVLLLDALNSWPEDEMYARLQMVKYLASLPPGMRIGIFTLDPRKLKLIWPLNQDSSALRLDIARFNAAHLKSGSAATQNQALLVALDEATRTAQDARLADSAVALQSFLKHGSVSINEFNHGVGAPFRELAHYLAGIPGRKNLFWVVGNVPWCGHSGECGETMDILAQAGVSVYPIDAHGVDVDMGLGPNPAFHQAAHRFIYSETWAEETGGKAYHANDIGQEIADAVEHGSHFYTLAYVPRDGTERGRERKIEVKALAGNYTVSYRRHYLERTQKEVTQATSAAANNPLLPQMGHGLPNTPDLPYRLKVVPLATQPAAGTPVAGQNAELGGKLTRYQIDFDLPPESLSLPLERGHKSLQVAVMVYGVDFKPVNWEIRTIAPEVSRPQTSENRNGVSFHTMIDAPSGEVYLRTGIYDPSSGRVGTLEIPLSIVSSER
jgi:VWFA-related protein